MQLFILNKYLLNIYDRPGPVLESAHHRVKERHLLRPGESANKFSDIYTRKKLDADKSHA